MANFENRSFDANPTSTDWGYDEPLPIIQENAATRQTFLVRTYLHLVGAVAAFVAIESVIISLFQKQLIEIMRTNSGIMMFGLLALCFAGPFIGNLIINRSKTVMGHYIALAFYVLMYVCMFIPILTYAMVYAPNGPTIVGQAAGMTFILFVGLTATVVITGKDFSFMRVFLVFGSLIAFGLIIASLIFGFQLGVLFTYVMIALACCYILYDTSNVMLHYPKEGYVIAAVELFASVMLLFFYVLRLFLSRNE